MAVINPMLCEPTEPEALKTIGPDWLWEIKLDGDRAILHIDNGVIIQNRRMVDVTYRYPELQRIGNGQKAILDGEIVVFDQNGKTDFNLLSHRTHLQNKFDIEMRMKSIPVTFMAFDILMFDGQDLRASRLLDRKEILYHYFAPIAGVFHYNMAYGIDASLNAMQIFEQAKQADLEGIVGKHFDSPYLEGKRSPYWKKVKNVKTVDMAFFKYTVNPAGIRLEAPDGTTVQCSGRQSKLVRHLMDAHGGVLAEVKYLNKTPNGRLRMPTFKALKGGAA